MRSSEALEVTSGLIQIPSQSVSPGCALVVCTYDARRRSRLERCLASIRTQVIEADRCVIVVDNNTEFYEVLTHAYERDDQIEVIENSRTRGLSGARNSGIAHTKEPLIAFVDDDASLGPGWVQSVRVALQGPRVGCVGTPVLPAWPNGVAPKWFPAEFNWVVGCTYSEAAFRGERVRNVVGAAMAVRRDALERSGDFSPDFGPRGKKPTNCDETELCIRISATTGADVRYVADAEAYHLVLPERCNVRYLLTRSFYEGATKARLIAVTGKHALDIERRFILQAPRKFAVRLLATFKRDGSLSRGLVAASGCMAFMLGFAVGRLRIRIGRLPFAFAATTKVAKSIPSKRNNRTHVK